MYFLGSGPASAIAVLRAMGTESRSVHVRGIVGVTAVPPAGVPIMCACSEPGVGVASMPCAASPAAASARPSGPTHAAPSASRYPAARSTSSSASMYSIAALMRSLDDLREARGGSRASRPGGTHEIGRDLGERRRVAADVRGQHRERILSSNGARPASIS